jgi:hypothetical protein
MFVRWSGKYRETTVTSPTYAEEPEKNYEISIKIADTVTGSQTRHFTDIKWMETAALQNAA